MLLAGEIAPVREPHRECARTQHAPDADALEVVRNGLLTDAGIGRCQRAGGVAHRLSGLVLERVRVDGIEAKPERIRFLAQALIVADAIPGKCGDTRGVIRQSC